MSLVGTFKSLAPNTAVRPKDCVPTLQYGALCFRVQQKTLQILLITSRDTGRWLLPKGWPVDGLSPPEVAAREAWEEGGVVGHITDECVGHLSYTKVLPDLSGVLCTIAVYPLKVASLAKRYPERNQRRRKWVALHKAGAMLQEPEAISLLSAFGTHPMAQYVGKAARPHGRG